MYPPDVLKKVEAQEMTAEEAERKTIRQIDEMNEILWPGTRLLSSQYDHVRKFLYDTYTHRSPAQ